MKLPNWFKIAWWGLLVAILTWFLYHRYQDLVAGNAATADVVVFVVWFALLLAPLFNEISLFGVTLKQEIAELKTFVAAQVSEVRYEVRNAVDVRTTFNAHVHMPAPPPDASLPNLSTVAKSVIAGVGHVQRAVSSKALTPLVAGDNVIQLFTARYSIEVELRRIAEARKLASGLIPLSQVPVSQLVRSLSDSGLLEPGLAGVVREVYAVCSPAVHGAPATDAQVSFVKDVAPQLVATLRQID